MAIKQEIIQELLGEATSGEELFGKSGLINQLTKQLIEGMLESEMSHHLGYEKHSADGVNTGNSRNGTTRKRVKTGKAELEIAVPRDRKSDFEPQLINKRQTRLAGLDDQILSLYGRGMTVRDIEAFLEELYGTQVSRDLISTITDGILEEVKQWRNRPLDKVYPIVYIDGFIAKTRLDGHVSNRTVYVVYGINKEGYKDVLALVLGEKEGAKYWLSVLTEIKNRGVEDIFLICADGLKGLPESIETAFPKAVFQTCIVHMVRNSLKYVPYKEKKAVASDLKKIYQADTLALAEIAMDDFELIWGEKYPAIIRSWRNNWTNIIPFFEFPKEIRRVIYTTNIIESLNRTFRKAVKTRGHFPTEDALMKVLYLSIKNVSRKWTMPIRNWSAAMNQFAIVFGERFMEE